MSDLETNTKRLVAAATKAELSGAELAAKLNKKYPRENYSARGLGRSIAAAVKAKKLVKVGPKSRPKYKKA